MGTEDRRDSPRVPMTFHLKDLGLPDGPWETREGDLSLGGIFWRGKTAPHGTEVDVRFQLPGADKEILARGLILRVKPAGTGLDFHVRFTDLDTPTELALAKFLDDWLASR